MLAHYVAMDEVATADAVLKAVAQALDPRASEKREEDTSALGEEGDAGGGAASGQDEKSGGI